ncbi:MAG: SH3 domain-containing protein [Candidatus Onthomonas sp.]
MFPVRKLIRTLVFAGAVAAMCIGTALAADTSAIPYEATVSTPSASLLEAPEAGSAVAVSLESGDRLVLLSEDDGSGWLSAAYEADEEQVYTGYIPAESVSVQALGRVSILTEDASLLQEAEEGSEVLTTLGKGASLEVLGYGDGWFYVEAKGKTGYVPLSDVACEVVTTSKLKLRSAPDGNSEVLEVLDKGTTLAPTNSEEEWYQVCYDGQEGYISSEYVTPAEADSFTVENPAMTDGEAVLAYAQQFLGNRYVWGGTSLTRGCDCSGYVMQIYAQFGVSLPHSSAAIRHYGTKVSYSEMQVGDVVCYSGHVGIYAGNGKIINALNSRAGICYTNVNYASIVTIRRML